MENLNQSKKSITNNEIDEFVQEMKQPSLFDNTKFYRFRSRLVELVEEIKLKRVTEKENEEKIRHLVQEKHELERKQESKQEELLNLSDDHEHKLQEQKRHLDDQIHSLKEQVKKLQVHREVNDKENKTLKDDIRSLQWTKYNLEKRLREQEHMLSAHHMSTDQHRNEMSTIEKKMAGMMSHYQHLADTLKRLELNVKEAVSHNKKLMYVNEHKNCQMNEIKAENEQLKRQVFEANVQRHLPLESPEAADLTSVLEDLQRQLKHEEDKFRKIQLKADDNNKKYEDVLKLLQEAHELTEKHLVNANKHQKESQHYRQKCDDLDQKIVTLTSEIEGLKKELRSEKIKYEDNLVSWAQKEKHLTLEVYQTKEKLMGKETEVLNLEDANSLWAAKNMELSTRLQAAEKKVNVERINQETQMGTSQLSLRSEGTQTRLSSQNNGTQTDPKSTKSMKTQCIIAALNTSGTQTVNGGVHLDDIASQTDITSLKVMLDSFTSDVFAKIRLESSSQIDQNKLAEKSTQANSSDQTSMFDDERPASSQDSKASPGHLLSGTSHDPQHQRQSLPRTSFQLPTSYTINEKFQAFEKHSDSFRRSNVPMTTAFLPTNMAAKHHLAKEDTQQQNLFDEAQKRSSIDSVLSNINPGHNNQSESNTSCAPYPKYARMSHLGPGLMSSPSIATRKTTSPSPFPSMGVKVIASRRESLSEVKTTLEFSRDSPKVVVETESISTVYTTPNIEIAETIQPTSSKGILKNPFEYRINTPKSVKFSNKRHEREITPDPDLVHASPELVYDNQNEEEPSSNQNSQTTSESYTKPE